jgi:hypothetical protein
MDETCPLCTGGKGGGGGGGRARVVGHVQRAQRRLRAQPFEERARVHQPDGGHVQRDDGVVARHGRPERVAHRGRQRVVGEVQSLERAVVRNLPRPARSSAGPAELHRQHSPERRRDPGAGARSAGRAPCAQPLGSSRRLPGSSSGRRQPARWRLPRRLGRLALPAREVELAPSALGIREWFVR